jgi:hypothetical protein
MRVSQLGEGVGAARTAAIKAMLVTKMSKALSRSDPSLPGAPAFAPALGGGVMAAGGGAAPWPFLFWLFLFFPIRVIRANRGHFLPPK